MRKNNKGFSLVELIVVIAIMSVLLGIFVYSISLVSGRDAQKCANNISDALDQAKSYAMAKSGSTDAYMEIRKMGNNFYIAEFYVPNSPVKDTGYTLIDTEKLGSGNVKISCNVGGSSYEIQGANKLKVTYDRLNGSFKQANIAGNTGKLQSIVVTRGRTYQLTMVQSTGKHTLERK